MRALINVFHPNLAQSRVSLGWTRILQDAGYSVRDLYGLCPGGVLNVPEERSLCEQAEVLVFMHPLHWYAAPWLAKRWIDEVLGHGWAYGGPDRLAGKTWLSALSVGAGAEEYGPEGSRRYQVEDFLRPFERTAVFCGMRWASPFVEFGGGYATDADIAKSGRRLVERLSEVCLAPPDV